MKLSLINNEMKEIKHNDSERYFKVKTLIYLIMFILLFINYSCSHTRIKYPSDSRIIENIPFYSQLENQCGPASLAAVLNYYGVATTPDEIATEIFSKSARGTLNIDMLIYARKWGLNAMHYNGSIEDIKAKIDAQKPLIVLVDLGSFFYTQNHYMVIIGYADNGVIVNSGASQKHFIEFERLITAWQKTDFLTLFISKKD